LGKSEREEEEEEENEKVRLNHHIGLNYSLPSFG